MAKRNMIGTIILLLMASTAQALDFSIVTGCGEADGATGKPNSWCLEGVFPINQKVAFLERPECHAKTGGVVTISGAEEEGPGTSLEDFNCSTAQSGDVVVLDIDVKEYRKLDVLPLSNKSIPNGIDARIRKNAEFRRLVTEHEPSYIYTKTLKLHLFEVKQSTPSAKSYVASYQSDGYEDQFVFLVTKTRVDAITQQEPGCVSAPEGFRLNGTDFLSINICACGTDGCERRYLELSKK
jgi:hypothetical protein